MKKINLKEKLSKFSDHWSPKIIAEMNDYQFKLVKIKGDFVWHNHADTDEAFIVVEGKMKIEFENETVELKCMWFQRESSTNHALKLSAK
jgi:mannose-6-phosphate isomerase-like protein (cupin superfamily)